MDVYPSALDIDALAAEAGKLEYWLDGAGVYMSITQSGGIPLGHPLIRSAIDEISELRKRKPLHLMINNLPRGITVVKHIDAVKSDINDDRKREKLERWHLPLKTNDKCYWWDQDLEDAGEGNINMRLGSWYGPMPYWVKHQVINLGETDRLHLIVDLE